MRKNTNVHYKETTLFYQEDMFGYSVVNIQIIYWYFDLTSLAQEVTFHVLLYIGEHFAWKY